MAVPTSGELSLLKIWSEKNEDDYSANNADGENSFSLRGVSVNSIGDSSGGNITLNTTYNPPGNRPDQSTPHKMSEFYGYDHDLNDGTYSFAGRVVSGDFYYIFYLWPTSFLLSRTSTVDVHRSSVAAYCTIPVASAGSPARASRICYAWLRRHRPA